MLNTSETIKDLEIPAGRKLLHQFFHDRRVKHRFELQTMLECWELCRRGLDVQFGDGRRVRLETNLGWRLGTRVFLEEIASTYYHNFIQGLVYLGATIVLVAVGAYLSGVTAWVVYVAFAAEALFLLLFALVTAFAAPEEIAGGRMPSGLSENMLSALNDSVREMSSSVSNLFHILSQSDIRQDVLLTRLTEHISRANAESFERYATQVEETNRLLRAVHARDAGAPDAGDGEGA